MTQGPPVGFIVDLNNFTRPDPNEPPCPYCPGYTLGESLAISRLASLSRAMGDGKELEIPPELRGLISREDAQSNLQFVRFLTSAMTKMVGSLAKLHDAVDEKAKRVDELTEELRTLNVRCDNLEVIVESDAAAEIMKPILLGPSSEEGDTDGH